MLLKYILIPSGVFPEQTPCTHKVTALPMHTQVPFLIGGHTLEWKTYYYICIVIHWKNVKIMHIFCAIYASKTLLKKF